MLSHEFIQNLSTKAAHIFPAASSIQKDIEANLYELMQGSFAKLNLVTREEFDAQLAVLKRAELTIAKMEEKISDLEQQLSN